MLANWMFFWDWGSAPISSAAAVVVALSSGAGSGLSFDNYEPLSDAYWEERAKRLAPPKIDKQAIRDDLLDELRVLLHQQAQLHALHQQIAEALRMMHHAPNVEAMKALVAHLRQLKATLAPIDSSYRMRVARVKMLRSKLLGGEQ